MRARILLGAVATVACAGAACFIDIPDVVSDAGGDTSVADAGLPDAMPVCDACGATPGFGPVLFALDRSTSCPAGLVTSDVVADPGSPLPGACTCACAVSNPPSCFPATLKTAYDLTADSGCDKAGATLTIGDAGCLVMSGNLGGGHVSIDSFVPADGGACVGSSTSDTSKIPTVSARRCAPPTCNTVMCAAPPGFRACFERAGDVACPTGLQKHLVGVGVDVSCACAACSITVDGGCEGTVTLYAASTCQIPVEAPIQVDGTCQKNGAPSGTPYQSLQYTPSLVGVGCVAGAPSVVSVALQQETTVCCPP